MKIGAGPNWKKLKILPPPNSCICIASKFMPNASLKVSWTNLISRLFLGQTVVNSLLLKTMFGIWLQKQFRVRSTKFGESSFDQYQNCYICMHKMYLIISYCILCISFLSGSNDWLRVKLVWQKDLPCIVHCSALVPI